MGEIDTKRERVIIMVWQYTITADTAVNKLRHTQATIRGFAILLVEMLTMPTGVMRLHQRIRANLQATQQYISGFIQGLVSQWSVSSVANNQATQDIYSGLMLAVSIIETETTGSDFAYGVTSREIRRQYNTRSGNEEGWEDGTTN